MAQNPFTDPNYGAEPDSSKAALQNPFSDPDYGAPSQGGTASDLGKSLKVGVQKLPGMLTGLADLPIALTTGARPFTKAADALGEATGFQPGKWADETKFSQGYEDSKKAVDAAWKDGSATDIAGAYLSNPAYTANQVAESLPSMVAGGVGSKMLLGAGRVAGVAADAAAGTAAKAATPGILARTVGEKWAVPVAAGVGEGAVTAGQQMSGYQGDDQQKNALAALGAGAGTAVIGVGAGRLANKMGLETAETAMARIGSRAGGAGAEVPLSLKQRVLGGMVSEAVLQELPQSVQEQMWSNFADGKPIMEGVGRAGTEGALAGGVMGAGANLHSGRTAAPDGTGLADNPAPDAPPLALGNTPDPMISFPDGSVGRQSEFDRYINGLPEDQRIAERAKLMGYDAQPADVSSPAADAPPSTAQEAQQLGYSPLAGTPTVFPDGSVALGSEAEFAHRYAPQPTKPSQAMGIDPNAGPLSKSAALAVDSGAYMPPAGQVPVAEPEPDPVVLQNRDRTSAASIAQMQEIAANPDYLRVGPSRDMTSGAPIVFGELPQTALLGRPETVVDGKGERMGTQYAVVDALDLIASNNADGTAVAEYATGAAGKLRSVAGNGRTAGLQAAYQLGTAQRYRQELAGDAAALGVDAQALAAMQRPVLVRVMQGADVTRDMGDRTNITATQKLSPLEQAGNDERRLDVRTLSFDEGGNPTPDSIKGFVSAMPVAERGDMLNADGTPTRQAVDRLMAATFKQAYESDELVQLYAQATDPDARAVMAAAADASGVLANLKGAGEFDVRGAVADAAKMAVNAARQGLKLQDVLQNADLDMHPEAFPVAAYLAQHIRTPKRMAEGLRRWGQLALEQARIAEENTRQGGMFGAAPTLRRQEIFARLGSQDNPTEQGIAPPAPAQQPVPAQAALEPAAQSPQTNPNGGPNGPQADQAQQAAPQQPEAPAPSAVERHPGWRQNAIQAGRVARALGLQPKGKRLAQIVAEIEAHDSEKNQAVERTAQAQLATENVAETDKNSGNEAASDAPAVVTKSLKTAAKDEAAQPAVDMVFSTTPAKPAKGMPVQRVQEIAQRVLDDLGIGSVAGLHTVREPSEAGFRVAATVVPQGATSNGQVYLFADNIGDEVEVFRVVVHELFHLGLSKSVQQGAYIQQMLGFLTDPLVRQYAQRWKLTEDGVSRKGTMPVNNWQALAVEEALADIAEDMHAERGGDGTRFGAWAARMASRFAKMAERMGLQGVAERIRAMSRTKAEQFVQDMLRRSSSSDAVQLRDARFSSERQDNQDGAFGAQPKTEDFVPNPDGGLDYGEITPEMGKAMRRQAGVIRLQQGVQNADGTGHGLAHIEANHGAQIRALGFDDVSAFVSHVARGIQQVWQVPGNSQLLVTTKAGRKDVMYIQLEIAKEGDFYRVNSAFPVRQQDYEDRRGMKKIWDGSEPTSTVAGQRPAFATAASASPEAMSSQGSSNARGQETSVPLKAPDAKFSRTGRADDLARVEADLDGMGVDHTIAEKNGVITISKIVVPQGQRNAGLGTQAMERIVAYADASAKHIALTPSADFGGNKSRLAAFYKRFGFKENKGKSKVYEVSEAMVRENPAERVLHSFAGASAPPPANAFGSMSPEQARAILALGRPPERATKDSVRAAVRELVNGLGLLPNGLGRIVVATSAEIKKDWEPLIGPVTMDAEGAGRAQGFYDPKTKTVFLIADNIRQGDELGVVAHELMHKHGPAVLGKEGWNQLHGAIGGWAKAKTGSMERIVYDEATRRVQASGPELSSQELFPYAVQVALEMGVRPNAMAPQGTVARWLAQVRAALRQAWSKIAGGRGDFNSLDLVNLAFGIAQRENPAHVDQLDGALHQQGTDDGVVGDVQFSRAAAIQSSMGTMTPGQEAAYKKVAGVQKVPTLKERADAMKANLGLRMKQALVDQFAPIRDVSQHAYMMARMSKASDGAMDALLLYGKPFLRDGVLDVNINDGGFAKVLTGLKGEHDRFFMWVAAQRGERLKAEGKENLMGDADISALKTLNAGEMADGTARLPLYAKALQELNAFNEAALKVALESGLIDQDAYDLMKNQPYVPFYRLMEEEGGMQGPKFSSGLLNQKAWKKLKGGTQQLNADLVQNSLQNWSHLYAASARNRAALATMDAAEGLGIAYKVPAEAKGSVKVMRAGMTEHWMVEDPYLLEAVSALNYTASPLMKPLAKMKQLLTWGVTVNPTFKIRNLIRDSVSAISQSELGYNPFANGWQGWKLTASDSQVYASMLASGGVIKFGTQENTDRLRAQVAKLGGVVLDEGGLKKFTGQLKSLYDVYAEFGDRTENVNRTALYDQLIKKGHSHAEASFMARDLMDFSMGGSHPAVRFLTQTVPFLNARLQGLYKLGRAAHADPRKFAAVAGAVSLASLVLLAAYGDDEDWKKREDWDRDAYWWFKVGETAFRIPKPFEVGAIGTLAERTAELMFEKEMTNKRFMERVGFMFGQTFAFNPVPQAIKPLLDIYANKDGFTKRAIESQADQRLRPQDRYNERTSEVARLLGSWGLPDPAQLIKGEYAGLSPKQIDYLLRGYFSWAGATAATVSDYALRPVMDRGARPDMRLRDVFIAGNFAESLPTGSSRYVSQLYEQARSVEQAYASYREAIKTGDMDKAAQIQERDGAKLRNRMAYANATKQLSEINAQAKRIEANRLLPGDVKRDRLTELELRRGQVAKRLSDMEAGR